MATTKRTTPAFTSASVASSLVSTDELPSNLIPNPPYQLTSTQVSYLLDKAISFASHPKPPPYFNSTFPFVPRTARQFIDQLDAITEGRSTWMLMHSHNPNLSPLLVGFRFASGTPKPTPSPIQTCARTGPFPPPSADLFLDDVWHIQFDYESDCWYAIPRCEMFSTLSLTLSHQSPTDFEYHFDFEELGYSPQRLFVWKHYAKYGRFILNRAVEAFLAAFHHHATEIFDYTVEPQGPEPTVSFTKHLGMEHAQILTSDQSRPLQSEDRITVAPPAPIVPLPTPASMIGDAVGSLQTVADLAPPGLASGIKSAARVGGLIESMINSPVATAYQHGGVGINPMQAASMSDQSMPDKTIPTRPVDSGYSNFPVVDRVPTTAYQPDGEFYRPFHALSPEIQTILQTWRHYKNITFSTNDPISFSPTMSTVVADWPILKQAMFVRCHLEFRIMPRVTMYQSCPLAVAITPYHPKLNTDTDLDVFYAQISQFAEMREKSEMIIEMPWFDFDTWKTPTSTDYLGTLYLKTINQFKAGATNIGCTIEYRPIIKDLYFPASEQGAIAQGLDDAPLQLQTIFTPIEDPLRYIISLPVQAALHTITHEIAFDITDSFFDHNNLPLFTSSLNQFATHIRAGYNMRFVASAPSMISGKIFLKGGMKPNAYHTGSNSVHYSVTETWDLSKSSTFSMRIPYVNQTPYVDMSNVLNPYYCIKSHGINIAAQTGAQIKIAVYFSLDEETQLFGLKQAEPIIDYDMKCQGLDDLSDKKLPTTLFGSIIPSVNMTGLGAAIQNYKYFNQQRPITSSDLLNTPYLFAEITYAAFQFKRPVKVLPCGVSFLRWNVTTQDPTAGFICTPAQVMSNFFEYWSGNLDLQIQVVTNTSASGKLMITHCPEMNYGGNQRPSFYALKGMHGTRLDLSLGREANIEIQHRGFTPLRTVERVNMWNDTMQIEVEATNAGQSTHGYLFITPATYISPTEVTAGALQFTISANCGKDFQFYLARGPKVVNKQIPVALKVEPQGLDPTIKVVVAKNPYSSVFVAESQRRASAKFRPLSILNTSQHEPNLNNWYLDQHYKLNAHHPEHAETMQEADALECVIDVMSSLTRCKPTINEALKTVRVILGGHKFDKPMAYPAAYALLDTIGANPLNDAQLPKIPTWRNPLDIIAKWQEFVKSKAATALFTKYEVSSSNLVDLLFSMAYTVNTRNCDFLNELVLAFEPMKNCLLEISAHTDNVEAMCKRFLKRTLIHDPDKYDYRMFIAYFLKWGLNLEKYESPDFRERVEAQGPIPLSNSGTYPEDLNPFGPAAAAQEASSDTSEPTQSTSTSWFSKYKPAWIDSLRDKLTIPSFSLPNLNPMTKINEAAGSITQMAQNITSQVANFSDDKLFQLLGDSAWAWAKKQFPPERIFSIVLHIIKCFRAPTKVDIGLEIFHMLLTAGLGSYICALIKNAALKAWAWYKASKSTTNAVTEGKIVVYRNPLGGLDFKSDPEEMIIQNEDEVVQPQGPQHDLKDPIVEQITKGVPYLLFTLFLGIVGIKCANEKDREGEYIGFWRSLGKNATPIFIGLGITRLSIEILPSVVQFFHRMIQWWRGRLPDNVRYLLDADKRKHDLVAWRTRVERHIDPESDLVLRNSAQARQEVYDDYAHGVEFSNALTKAEVPPQILGAVNSALALLREVRNKCRKYGDYKDARMCPFAVAFCGEPGIGKSSLLMTVATQLCIATETVADKLAYGYTPDKPHWDGYEQQPCVIYDELAPQLQDPTPYIQFQTIVSNNVWHIPMADLKDKGMQFTSKFIIGASNLKYPNPQISDVGAYQRRFPYRCEVKIRKITIQDPNDPNQTIEVDAPFAPDMSHLSFDRIPSVEGKMKHDVAYKTGMDFDDCMRDIIKACSRHFDGERSVMNMRMKESATYATELAIPNRRSDLEYGYDTIGFEAFQKRYLDSKQVPIITDNVILNAFPPHCFTDLSGNLPPTDADKKIIYFNEHTADAHAKTRLPAHICGAIYHKDISKSAMPIWMQYVIWVQLTNLTIELNSKQHIEQDVEWWIKTFFGELSCPTWARARQNAIMVHLMSLKLATDCRRCFVRRYLDPLNLHQIEWRTNDAKISHKLTIAQLKKYSPMEQFKACTEFLSHWAGYYYRKHHRGLLMTAGLLTVLAGAGGVAYILYRYFKEDKLVPQGTAYGNPTVRRKKLQLRSPEVAPQGHQGTTLSQGVADRIQYNMFTCEVSEPTATDAEFPANYVFNVFGLGKRCFLTNKHLWTRTLKRGYRTIKLHGVFDRKIQTQFVRATNVGESDLVILHFAHESLPEVPEIIKHFVSTKDLDLYQVPDAILFAAIPDYDITKPLAKPKEVHLKATLQCRAIKYQDKFTTETYHIPTWYKYNYSVSGLCASPLVVAKPATQGSILGFHAFGSDQFGGAIVVTKELIESLYNTIDHGNAISPKFEGYLERTKQRLVPQGDNVVCGKISRSDMPRYPTKTQLAKTKLHGLVFPEMKQPAVLDKNDPRNVDGIDPLARSMSKYQKPGFREPVDERFVRLAVDGIGQELAALNYQGPRILGLHEAINGRKHSEFITRINFDSSPGYPYVICKNELGANGAKGKKWLFDSYLDDDDTELYSMRPALEQQYEYRLQKAKLGKRITSIWLDCLKDELRPIEKVHKTRVFNIGPIDYTLLERQYTLPFFDMCMSNLDILPFKCGINAEGLDWTILGRSLQRTNSVGRDCDFSQFDSSHSSQALRAFQRVVRNWVFEDADFNDPETREHLNVLNVVLSEIDHKTNLAHDVVYQLFSGLNSGNPATTHVNNFLQVFYFFWSWCYLAEEQGETHLVSWQAFRDHVELCTYGDDGLQFSSPEYPWFNNNECARICARWSVTLTTSNKNTQVSELKPLEQLSFISRGFNRYEDCEDVWTAPLKMESITELINYWRVGRDELIALNENIDNAYRFMHAYGEQKFEEFAGKIRAALRENNIRLPRALPTFAELDYQFQKNIGY